MKKIFYLLSLLILTSFLNAQVFISEIHYDNIGGDVGEGVEVSGPAGTDLTGWYIQPYNGNGGGPYTPVGNLSGTIPNEGSGFGSVWVGFAPNGLQNGSPDGVALINNLGIAIEFLSYEGSFTATNGPASGQTSVDVGVVESNATTTIGSSMQLRDAGWVTGAAESPGLINAGLTLGGPPTPTMTATPNSLSGLGYVFGAATSPSLSGVVTSSNLEAISSVSGSLTSSTSSNPLSLNPFFEFSVDDVTFYNSLSALFSANPLLTASAFNLAPVTIYVRLKLGLGVGTYNETITISNTGGTTNAADVTITLSGEVTAAPVVCTQTLQALPYTGINGTAGFDHSSANPPPAAPAEACGSNFLLSYTTDPLSNAAGGNEFGNQSNLGLTGLSSSDFGGEASFQTFPVDVSGVTAIDINAFGNTIGSNVFNATSEQFEWWYTLDGGSQIPFFTTTSDGSLAASSLNLDVTGIDSIVVGFTFNINGGGDGFENMDVTIEEYLPTPQIIGIPAPTNGFLDPLDYAGIGPSAIGSGTIEGENLTGSFTVSGAGDIANFEFSVNGSPFGAFPGTLTAATLNASIALDVRLKSGLPVGMYTGTIIITNTGGTPNAPQFFIEFTGEVTLPVPTCDKLFISEYIETGNTKMLEFYNPTSASINLSGYTIRIYANGSNSAGTIIALANVALASGATHVLGLNDAGNTFSAYADQLEGGNWFNGNDAIEFVDPADNVLDVMGIVGVSLNFGETKKLVRKSNVQSPNAIYDANEWDDLPIDVTNLGFHSSSCYISQNQWEGFTSTDWNDGTNWTNGYVPGPSDEVFIPAVLLGTFYPTTTSDITVRKLEVEANSSLTIGAGYGLILGTNADVDIYGPGALTLEANASGTAWFDDFTNAGVSFTGDLTSEQYVSTGNALGQRMFGSPIDNGLVQGLDQTYASASSGQIEMSNCASAQVDVGSPYNNMFEWHEDAPIGNSCQYEAWFARSQSTALENGRGYSGWMNLASTISFTGTPNSGTIVYGGSLGNSGSGLIDRDGWHVLSNPYPSSVNVNPITSAGWSSPQTYVAGGGGYAGSFQPILPGDDLGVGQGFVAEITSGNTVTFTNAMRTQGSTSFKSINSWYDAKLNIEVSNGSALDVTYIYFNQNASAGFDAQWDCKKRSSDAGLPTIYTKTGAFRTSLNGNDINELGNYSFPLGLSPGTANTFTFEVSGLGTLPASTMVYLEDKATGTWTNLRDQNTYTFNMTMQEAEERFEIHFTKPIAIFATGETCEANDGSINIDFGNQSINNNLIAWDYEILNNLNVIASGSEANLFELQDLSPGNYDAVFTNGNLEVETSITVEDKAQVEAEFTSNANQLFVDDEFLATNSSTGATSYTWEVNNEVFTSTDLTYTFTTPGTYVVSLFAENADCDAIFETTVEVNEKTATGIAEQVQLGNALVYTRANNILVDLTKVQLEGKTDLEVYNLVGQLMIQKLNVQDIESIEMNQEAKGIYIVRILNQQDQVSKKVILK